MTPENAIPFGLSDFVEGGAVPVDRNLLWKECRFNLFDYGGKAPTTCALRVTYVDDDGQEFVQQYSAADPTRFTPSEDGKKLGAVGQAQALSKSSNFFLLMNELVNAGFPENKLAGMKDASLLDGTYAYHIGLPEPKRSGLAPRAVVEGQVAREKILSVPQKVLRLPWEKKPGKATTAKAGAKAPPVTEEEGDELTATALLFVNKVVAEGPTTRTKLASKIFADKDIAKSGNRDAIAGLIFKPAFLGALLADGFTIDGENISKG